MLKIFTGYKNYNKKIVIHIYNFIVINKNCLNKKKRIINYEKEYIKNIVMSPFFLRVELLNHNFLNRTTFFN